MRLFNSKDVPLLSCSLWSKMFYVCFFPLLFSRPLLGGSTKNHWFQWQVFQSAKLKNNEKKKENNNDTDETNDQMRQMGQKIYPWVNLPEPSGWMDRICYKVDNWHLLNMNKKAVDRWWKSVKVFYFFCWCCCCLFVFFKPGRKICNLLLWWFMNTSWSNWLTSELLEFTGDLVIVVTLGLFNVLL